MDIYNCTTNRLLASNQTMECPSLLSSGASFITSAGGAASYATLATVIPTIAFLLLPKENLGFADGHFATLFATVCPLIFIHLVNWINSLGINGNGSSTIVEDACSGYTDFPFWLAPLSLIIFGLNLTLLFNEDMLGPKKKHREEYFLPMAGVTWVYSYYKLVAHVLLPLLHRYLLDPTPAMRSAVGNYVNALLLFGGGTAAFAGLAFWVPYVFLYVATNRVVLPVVVVGREAQYVLIGVIAASPLVLIYLHWWATLWRHAC